MYRKLYSFNGKCNKLKIILNFTVLYPTKILLKLSAHCSFMYTVVYTV